ncbi:unnamed protein product [Amoebophrya sp. A120]|nr:unnamed protein product [Amoebophrya sp. A120]|eukprot:GSA120T00006574001.1
MKEFVIGGPSSGASSSSASSSSPLKLSIADELFDFLSKEALPNLPLNNNLTVNPNFFDQLGLFLYEFTDRQKALLKKRDEIQRLIDEKGPTAASDLEFLKEIGYLVEVFEGNLSSKIDFQVQVEDVDAELALLNAPQLVVPVDNARFAVNAANSRWGSLFDALYEADVLPQNAASSAVIKGYDPNRGLQVFAKTFEYLDLILPLGSEQEEAGSWRDVAQVKLTEKSSSRVSEAKHGDSSGIKGGTTSCRFKAQLANGVELSLRDPASFVGYNLLDPPGTNKNRCEYFFRHNNLHLLLKTDSSSPAGKQSKWNLSDVVLEACPTVIMDNEDATASVDAADKTKGYRNWLKLMKRELTSHNASGKLRKMNDDLEFTSAKDNTTKCHLPGTCVLLNRNVGLHIFTDAVLLNGQPVPEGLLDLFLIATLSMHDVFKLRKNSRTKNPSVYIVRPKLHGPEEVSFVNEAMNRCEDLLGYKRHSIKIGVMDEERRTSANLVECIRAVKNRIFFINTGFLDRVGDEIHTMFKSKKCLRKADIKKSTFLNAYEQRNVRIGVSCGLHKYGQIGKGMWAEPDNMKAMLEQKIGHCKAGASTAWVPKPIGATLHVLHYHMVDVGAIQKEFEQSPVAPDFLLAELLTQPALPDGRIELSREEIDAELHNNLMGLLGYISRWVQLGLGASKVQDINGTPLMEDLATLRISSQAISNWLHHQILDWTQVEQAMDTIAKKVDANNKNEKLYQKMEKGETSYQCALEVLKNGPDVSSGYVCNTLAKYRKLRKEQDQQSVAVQAKL